MKVKSPRFDFVYDKACEFLLSMGTSCLPVNPLALISRSHWGLVTYSELCSIVSGDARIADIADIVEACQSRDGFTVCSGGNFCIAYNDTVRVKSRVAFTLMHEVGHIVCGHFSGQTVGLCREDYRVFETEANFFSGNVLAPASVVTACNSSGCDSSGCDSSGCLQRPELLQAACGLSHRAAKVRLNELANWMPRPVDEEIRRAFGTYIDICNRRSQLKKVDIVYDEVITQ